MKKHILFLSILSVLILSSCSKNEIPVIYPEPHSIEKGNGSFAILSDVTVLPGEFTNDSFLVTYLTKKIKVHTGTDINSGTGDVHDRTIIFSRSDGKNDLGKEGYLLHVGKKKVTIEANSEAGIFYGINTLLQLIGHKGSSSYFYGVNIKDRPTFSWRGMHLDVSRHFFPKAFIKKYIDILAMHKMNVFHWHLTDDQGWRIQIDKYPKLTTTAAWRVDHTDRPWGYDVTITGDTTKKLYGGYYTKDDIREIVKYAADRFVTVVPEIEMPGHSLAALTAYPQFSCSGKPYHKPAATPFEFTDPYCAGNDSTFIFLEDVLSEVMDLFPSKYIHIGGDEAKKTPWEKDPRDQAVMKKAGLTNTNQLQAWFISRIDSFIRAHGRYTIGWDEIMEGKLPTSAAIMAWRNASSAGEAIREGFNTVVATSKYYYLSTSQDNLNDLPSRILTLKDVFDYNPVPDSLTPEQAKRLMGISGSIWTENIQTPEQVEVHLLPRLAAIAETAWSDSVKMDYNTFLSGLPRYFKFLDAESVAYYIDSPKGFKSDKFYLDQYTVKMHSNIPGTDIRYTLDGSDPDQNSALYRDAIVINQTSTVKARNILPSGKSSPVRTAFIEKISLLNPVDSTGNQPGLLLKTVMTPEISSLDDMPAGLAWDQRTTSSLAIPGDLSGKDHFALQFSGFFNAPADGIYGFYTTSDDGSRLYIDGQRVVDNDGVHGDVTASGQIGLRKGMHSIRIDYFEAKFGEDLKIDMDGPGIKKSTINPDLLSH